MRWSLLALLLSFFVLQGCANRQSSLYSSNDQPVISKTQNRSTDSDLLYQVLVGEVAGRRGRVQLSAEHYTQAAVASDNPKVAERAVRVAVFAKDDKRSLQAALRWIELAPDNIEAHQVVAALYAREQKLTLALKHLNRVIELNGTAEDKGFAQVFSLLGRGQEMAAGLEIMQALVKEHAKNPYAHFTYASLALRADKAQLALQSASVAIRLKPGFIDAEMIKAKALVKLGRIGQALKEFELVVKKSPEHQEMRLSFARMLVEAKFFERARHQFEMLHKMAPADADLLYTLGLLSIEAQRVDDAAEYFGKLVIRGKKTNDAAYYLGRISAMREKYSEAIEWYQRVKRGSYRQDAQIRISQMLANQGDIDAARKHLKVLRRGSDYALSVRTYQAEGEILGVAKMYHQALAVYDEALALIPDNTDLLYARALTGEKVGRIDILERDIKSILVREPDNAHALNAIGYSLADKTTRYEEALEYILRAVALAPEEAAIIDSLGWIYYRLGQYDNALEQLKRAASLLPDAEISAHLGEVLWVSGEHKEAQKVWQRALNLAPDNDVLLEAIHRLKQ
ncbi:MAG: tetratricopeptide repeat protein [Gammaproteobacteria bacterium]|nr:tetratricopeptide repeat protein [Gammaproteobacteria bacterium]